MQLWANQFVLAKSSNYASAIWCISLFALTGLVSEWLLKSLLKCWFLILNGALNSSCMTLICEQIRKWLILIGVSYSWTNFFNSQENCLTYIALFCFIYSLSSFTLIKKNKTPHQSLIQRCVSAVTHRASKVEKKSATFVPHAGWIEMRRSNI